MDKHEFSRGPDTGKQELLKLIKVLEKSGYKFLWVEPAESFYAYSEATFCRDISYSTKEGDWINDNHIKIKIEYSDNFDNENADKYIKNEEKIFNGEQSNKFIRELFENCKSVDNKTDTDFVIMDKV